MTKESAEKFLDRMESDPSFRKKVLETENKEERTKFLKNSGFNYTKEEIIEAYETKTHEILSEQDLKDVRAAGITKPHVNSYSVCCVMG